ncbi:MAG: DUF4838 domain-containing protein [Clostridia bacterium]|nr:DUF4838 domain-containing protein [Clostridia bacterium]
MKKAFCIMLGLVMFVMAIPFTAFAAENEFPVYDAVVVAGENASATDKFAAEKLAFYLGKILGKAMSVVDDTAEKADYEIIVGETAREAVDLSSRNDGGYTITSDAEKVVICGKGNKGTINGVYAFLEKYCGCNWYESGVIVTPENAQLTVPADINDTYNTFFEYTETDTTSSRDTEFSLANGQTGGVYRDFTVAQGSGVEYIGSFAHTLANQICKPDMYFAEHPEYFALHGGKRVPEQLCLTNEDVKAAVTQEVLDLLAAQHNPDASIQIVSLTQHDNQLYCECENCAAIDKENGAHSGTMITFVNDIAKRVKAAGNYDNIAFDTFAYQYTRQAPSKVKPREDVIVRLCSIECCFGHTLDNPDCKENAAFMHDLEQWGKICNRIYIWDYVHNYAESVCLFPNFGVMQRNVQIFYENNVKGVYEEGNYYINECDGEFGEMRTYLLAKLLQNPYCDYYAEMDGYLNAVYGPGGKFIREFIDIATAHAVTNLQHLKIYQKSQNTLYNMSNADIEYCNELWEKAKAAAENAEQLSQIERSELSWRYWKAVNRKSEFSLWQFPYLWMRENEKLYNDFRSMGIIRMNEGGNSNLSECNLLYLYRIPTKWTTLYNETYWDALNPYAVKLYNFLGEVYRFFGGK